MKPMKTDYPKDIKELDIKSQLIGWEIFNIITQEMELLFLMEILTN